MLNQGYCFMPNVVLYSTKLTDKQKLLFWAISNLCAEKGYCRATNDYLWELLWADKRTISRNLTPLLEEWFISIGEDEQWRRTITLDKNVVGGRQKCLGGVDKNVYHNNTIEYNKEKKEIKKKKVSTSLSELVEAYRNDERVNQAFLEEDVIEWLEYKESRKELYEKPKWFIQQLVVAKRTITQGQPKLDIQKRFTFAVNDAISKKRQWIHWYDDTEREYLATKKDLFPNPNLNE